MIASSSVVLSNLAYLVGALVLAVIGGLLVWLHHRQPRSVDANMETFHRGLQALAPDSHRAAATRRAGSAPASRPRPPSTSVRTRPPEPQTEVVPGPARSGDEGSGAETG